MPPLEAKTPHVRTSGIRNARKQAIICGHRCKDGFEQCYLEDALYGSSVKMTIRARPNYEYNSTKASLITIKRKR